MSSSSFFCGLLSRFLDISDVVTFYKSPEILTVEEVLSRRTVIRWGDGESTLALGKSTSFQNADQRLAAELRRLLRTDSPNMVLCFPYRLLGRRPFNNASAKYRNMWLITAVHMRLFARFRPTAEALLFRSEGSQDGRSVLFKLLENSQRVVVVSSNPAYLKSLRSNLDGNLTLEHILVPKTNAYEVRNKLLGELLAMEPPDIILLSAGPVGKCIAVDLMKNWPASTKVIDTGHLLDQLAYGDGLK